MIAAPLNELSRWLADGLHDSVRLDKSALDFLGVFVLRNALSPATTQKYLAHYHRGCATGDLKPVEFHQTAMNIPENHPLHGIGEEPEVLAILHRLFNGNVGSDRIRLVRKDQTNSSPVFLHHDIGYLRGFYDKYALFFALTPSSEANGGLVLYPGTHHFGYLGDVGEIRSVLPPDYPVLSPSLAPGDLLIMHMGTWHQSGVNTQKTERVYLEITALHADDPSVRKVLCGQRQSPWQLDLETDLLFKSSRQQRIRQLYQQIQTLEKKGHPQ